MDPAAVWAKGGSAAELSERQADLQWAIWKLSARAYSVLAAGQGEGTPLIFVDTWRRLAAKRDNFPEVQQEALLRALADPAQAAALSARLLEVSRPFLAAVAGLHPPTISPARLGFQSPGASPEVVARRALLATPVSGVEEAISRIHRAYVACLERSGPSGRSRIPLTDVAAIPQLLGPDRGAPEVIWGFVAGGSAGSPVALCGPDLLTCRLFRRIARAQWSDHFWPMLEQQRRPAVMSAAAHRSVMQLMSGVGIQEAGSRSILVDQRGDALSDLRTGPLTADRAALHAILLQSGTGELARIATPRFIVMYAASVQRREDWRAPVTFASWSELAERLGVSAKETARVKALIGLLSCVHVRYPDGSSCSLFDGFRDKKGNPSSPGYVQLIPGPPWLGDRDPFMRAVNDRSAAVRALVPIVGLPEAVGSPRDYAAEARLWLGGVLPALTDQQRELARGTGAHLPAAWWGQQADRWGISGAAAIRKVVDAWSGEGGPLQRVERDRYHLASRYAAERALLEAGGRLREARSARGHASSMKRIEASKVLFKKSK